MVTAAALGQAGSVWPDLVKFRNFGQILEGQLNICQIFEPIWAQFYVIEQILIVANGQILKN